MPYTAPAHTAVDLTLGYALPTSADLTLGVQGEASQVDHFDAALTGRITLRAALSANYDNAVFRGLRTDTRAPHETAQAQTAEQRLPWQPSAALPVSQALLFDPASAVPVDEVALWMQAQAQQAQASTDWEQAAQATHDAVQSDWGYAAATLRHTAAPWGASAAPAGLSLVAESNQAAATPHWHRCGWERSSSAVRKSTAAGFDQAALAHRDTRIAPWQQALLVASSGGPWVPWTQPVMPPEPVRYLLRLCRRLPVGTTLILGADPCTGQPPSSGALAILPARFYMAVHSIRAYRVSDNIEVPIYNVSMSADVGSFGWTFSAAGPASVFEALAPSSGLPVSLRVEIDGMTWVFLVDSLSRSHEFGKREVRYSGRSATALIGEPYARSTQRLNATPQNAQQLAAAALDLTGVGLDWGITDWLVPMGAWSHTGTPLAAVQAIAEAAGGHVNSHRSLPTLLVRHPYPTLPGGVPGGPWNWATASAVDVELAPDAIITSSIERKDGPDINGVYVSGTSQGVLALVKRIGTAGEKLAGMITSPLITHVDAARQRGLSVLGKAGAKQMVQINLPVLNNAGQPGVLDVNHLVQINEAPPWRGRVRSVSVSAAMPSVRQSVTLERHL